jgi:hypothetical protein
MRALRLTPCSGPGPGIKRVAAAAGGLDRRQRGGGAAAAIQRRPPHLQDLSQQPLVHLGLHQVVAARESVGQGQIGDTQVTLFR